MKAGRKRQTITEKEAVLMNMLWNDEPLFVREMLDRYPEPKPHFNTIATTIRILEKKGHVGHECFWKLPSLLRNRSTFGFCRKDAR